jgi:hypothetical protein
VKITKRQKTESTSSNRSIESISVTAAVPVPPINTSDACIKKESSPSNKLSNSQPTSSNRRRRASQCNSPPLNVLRQVFPKLPTCQLRNVLKAHKEDIPASVCYLLQDTKMATSQRPTSQLEISSNTSSGYSIDSDRRRSPQVHSSPALCNPLFANSEELVQAAILKNLQQSYRSMQNIPISLTHQDSAFLSQMQATNSPIRSHPMTSGSSTVNSYGGVFNMPLLTPNAQPPTSPMSNDSPTLQNEMQRRMIASSPFLYPFLFANANSTMTPTASLVTPNTASPLSSTSLGQLQSLAALPVSAAGSPTSQVAAFPSLTMASVAAAAAAASGSPLISNFNQLLARASATSPNGTSSLLSSHSSDPTGLHTPRCSPSLSPASQQAALDYIVP